MFGGRLDQLLFALYLVANICLGLWVSRRRKASVKDYFLAGEQLPWYAIGGSIIAANISTEHFIGMVGAAYAVGFVVAQWEWGNWFTFSALVWIFLPYYLRGGIYTMPEFLERRYNKSCRYMFAVCSLVLWIVAQMAVVLLAGAKALEGMFGLDPIVTIVLLTVLAGSYTIYGGLIAVAWTDFLQFVVLMLGGLIVSYLGLQRAGGIVNLMHQFPAKFKIIYPITDPNYPWFGVFTLFLSIGIWYNCTNQFIVQRCLGARSEWDARMGVIFAGFMKLLLPFLVVIPGIVAFQLFPGLVDPDQAYPRLVKELVPLGLGGVVMAGIASALLSHLSSVLNSCSTVFTMDLYRPFFGQGKGDGHLVSVGRWSGFLILMLAMGLAIWFTHGQHSVFLVIQNVGAWVAAPIAVVFLLGVLWKRATAEAATFVLIFGFPYTALVEYVLFKHVWFLQPFDNWLNRTFLVWATCMVVMVVVSYLTPAPPAASVDGILWSRKYLDLPESERAYAKGARSLLLWWGLMVGLAGALYAYVIWFQFWGPGRS
ncbi:sodium/solute symporter [uncultured Paludibaculum sp.]|uniref:SLC5 family protein n=1 Tax=uncultured Paludibaculum sp. TaxID=1765020 RepID=UPI002AABB5BC|nr:sodium/solute symporter [uncultured Paludibaculum sp.]